MKVKEVVLNNLKKLSLLEWIVSGTLILSGIVVGIADQAGYIDELMNNKENSYKKESNIIGYALPSGYYLKDGKGYREVYNRVPSILKVDKETGVKSYYAPNGYTLCDDEAYSYKIVTDTIDPTIVRSH